MLIAFSGLKGSGKDTAAAVLVKEYGFTKIAFADALREGLLILNPQVEVPMSLGRNITDPFTSKQMCVERLADLVAAFGWDFLKREVPEIRRLMQVFGTEVGRMLLGENVWIDILAERYEDIATENSRYVITDCRFDNEIDFVHRIYGTVFWIDRPGLTSDGHASESTEIKSRVDYLILNDSTLAEFEEDIRLAMFLRGVDRIE